MNFVNGQRARRRRHEAPDPSRPPDPLSSFHHFGDMIFKNVLCAKCTDRICEKERLSCGVDGHAFSETLGDYGDAKPKGWWNSRTVAGTQARP
jgi:hypothetical protein